MDEGAGLARPGPGHDGQMGAREGHRRALLLREPGHHDFRVAHARKKGENSLM